MNNKGNYVHLIGRISGFYSDFHCVKVSLIHHPDIVIPVFTNNDYRFFQDCLVDVTAFFDDTGRGPMLSASKFFILDPDISTQWFCEHTGEIYEMYDNIYPGVMTSDSMIEEDDPDGFVKAAEMVYLPTVLAELPPDKI